MGGCPRRALWQPSLVAAGPPRASGQRRRFGTRQSAIALPSAQSARCRTGVRARAHGAKDAAAADRATARSARVRASRAAHSDSCSKPSRSRRCSKWHSGGRFLRLRGHLRGAGAASLSAAVAGLRSLFDELLCGRLSLTGACSRDARRATRDAHDATRRHARTGFGSAAGAQWAVLEADGG